MAIAFRCEELLTVEEERELGQRKTLAELEMHKATLATPWAVRVVRILREKLDSRVFLSIARIVDVDKDSIQDCNNAHQCFDRILRAVSGLAGRNGNTPWLQIGEELGKIGLRFRWVEAIRSLMNDQAPHRDLRIIWDEKQQFALIRVSRQAKAEMLGRLNKAENQFYAVRNTMVERNLKMVKWIVSGMLGASDKTKSLEKDAQQEGVLGLMTAADYWDWEVGLKFSTYATNWIKTRVSRYLLDQSSLLRLPAGVQERLLQIKSALSALSEKTPEAIAEKTGIDEAFIQDAITENFFWRWGLPISSDPKEQGTVFEGSLFEDKAESPEDKIDGEACCKAAMRYMGKYLNAREIQCLMLRYGSEELFPIEVAAELGISREGARQMEQRALRKLRERS